MKRSLLAYSIALSFIFTAAKAQDDAPPHRTCGTMEHYERMKLEDPGFEERRQKIEEQIQQYANSTAASQRAVITIPVVFHVVYETNAENISDERLLEQLQVLNYDYRKMNFDRSKVPSHWQSIAADTEIQFCLAMRDPNGNPTTGITRTSTTVASFSDDDDVKFASRGGHDVWDRSKYLNIWVCDLGSWLLGYAQFPGGSSLTDGVVLNYRYTGITGATTPFNKGRTATHEVGHWLSLLHIWGDDGSSCSGSDLVGDTPNQADESSGCPSGARVSCSNGTFGDMWMNYMDYTNDGCMYIFTEGQKTRMRAVVTTGSRASLAASNGCTPVSTPVVDAGISLITSPAGALCGPTVPKVTLTNFGTSTLTSVEIHYRRDYNAGTVYNWTGSLAPGASTVVTLPTTLTLAAGSYSYTAYTMLPNGIADENAGNDHSMNNFTVVSGGTTANLSEGFENLDVPPAGWAIINPDNNVTWARTTSAKGFGNSTASLVMDNYSGTVDITGERDELRSPSYSLIWVKSPATLNFNVAYAQYNTTSTDSLIVLASTNCGSTWTRIFASGGSSLATASPTTAVFVPTSSEWAAKSININSYIGQQNVMFSFMSVSGYGNMLYIDDINISHPAVGIDDRSEAASLEINPNPSGGKFSVALALTETSDIKIRIMNTLGETITEKQVSSTPGGSFEFDLSDNANGIYFVEVTSGSGVLTRRIVVSK